MNEKRLFCDSSSYGAALSGIQAASARLSASANNIANSDTPGYQRQQVTTTSGVYGVEVTVERIDSLVQQTAKRQVSPQILAWRVS